MTEAERACAEELIEFIDAAPSPYHAAQNPNPAWERITNDTIERIRPGKTFYLPLFRTGAVVVSVGENPRGRCPPPRAARISPVCASSRILSCAMQDTEGSTWRPTAD